MRSLWKSVLFSQAPWEMIRISPLRSCSQLVGVQKLGDSKSVNKLCLDRKTSCRNCWAGIHLHSGQEGAVWFEGGRRGTLTINVLYISCLH